MEEIKVKILEFVKSLSKDEPFCGDEVGELSRYFVNALCQQNGEDDQVKHILADPENDSLFDQCVDLYENANGYDGQAAVIRHCESINHPNWGSCEDCECMAPFQRNKEGQKKCLICSFGNIVDKEEE